ncbi:class I SAM-dependent methyltransferase [Macrococcus epidermidis]|uniref:class I SAM-dependent methyltransferase n=1 Tax=Macrococcus epidermidis TaxID=1902580 RepID=UPI0020B77C82|nr:methyltransferase domain-containing protein [Macrococcus epidermidis]UTH16601.1 methyltransferase domain-containing protein [Macrococcus epidermidis]
MNHWDDKFKDDTYLYGEEANQFVKEQFQDKGKGSIACFAEGEGRNAVYLAQLGYDVATFDYSKEGLKKTEKLAEKFNVHVETNLKDLTVEEAVDKAQFDNAVMIFGHVEEDKQQVLFNNMIQSVKAEGKIYFELYAKAQIDYGTGGPKDISMLYDLGNVKKYSESNDVNIIELAEKEVVRHEGDKHNGKCRVIQGILEKQ